MNVNQDITKFNFNNVSMICLEIASNEQTKTNKRMVYYIRNSQRYLRDDCSGAN